MVEAKEFRIGNYVNISVDWGSVTEITGFQIDEIFLSENKEYKCKNYYKSGHIEVYLRDLSPIPLTEEILLKCGFNMIDKEGFKISQIKKDGIFSLEIRGKYPRDTMFIRFDVSENSILCELSLFEKNHRVYIDIKYLHQLQNLHFALTGKELDIKL